MRLLVITGARAPVPLVAIAAFPEVAVEFTVIVPLKFPAVAGRNETVTFCVALGLIVPLKFPLNPSG